MERQPPASITSPPLIHSKAGKGGGPRDARAASSLSPGERREGGGAARLGKGGNLAHRQVLGGLGPVLPIPVVRKEKLSKD